MQMEEEEGTRKNAEAFEIEVYQKVIEKEQGASREGSEGFLLSISFKVIEKEEGPPERILKDLY